MKIALFSDILIGPDERTCLATLPAHIRIEFHLPHGSLSLLLVHSSPAYPDSLRVEFVRFAPRIRGHAQKGVLTE
jgi:hypothetical protein